MYCVMWNFSNNTYEYYIIINHANLYMFSYYGWSQRKWKTSRFQKWSLTAINNKTLKFIKIKEIRKINNICNYIFKLSASWFFFGSSNITNFRCLNNNTTRYNDYRFGRAGRKFKRELASLYNVSVRFDTKIRYADDTRKLRFYLALGDD